MVEGVLIEFSSQLVVPAPPLQQRQHWQLMVHGGILKLFCNLSGVFLFEALSGQSEVCERLEGSHLT